MFIRTLIIFLFISGVAWGQNLTPSTHALNPADFTGKYIYSDGTSFIPVSKSDILGYTSYVALLSQSLTNPPVVTVLVNELGGEVVWTRVDVGYYNGTLTGAFTTGKTFYTINWAVTADGADNGKYAGCMWTSENVITVYTVSGQDGLDSELLNTPIEIRVYN